jgi:hypothetical protein
MGFFARAERRGCGWRAAVAVLCAFLVVLAGAVQVAHSHPVATASHADCSLCVAAHIALQAPQSPAQAAPLAVATAVELTPVQVGRTAVGSFALFTRPPPHAADLPA